MLRRVLPLVLLATVPMPALAQTLSDEAVTQAISTGAAGRAASLEWTCTVTPPWRRSLPRTLSSVPTGRYDVFVSNSLGRIADLAAAAARRYEPFEAAQVDPDLRTLAVFVTAVPQEPVRSGGQVAFSSPIETVVLKAGSHVARPSRVSLDEVAWPNAGSGGITGTRAVASFAFDAFAQLPPGDLTLALVTTAGEMGCTLDRDARARLSRLTPGQ